MLGESTDEKNRVPVVKGDGHERTVRVALRLEGQSAQGSGRDPTDQCSGTLGVRWYRDIYVVQRFRRVACSGVGIFPHGSPCMMRRPLSRLAVQELQEQLAYDIGLLLLHPMSRSLDEMHIPHPSAHRPLHAFKSAGGLEYAPVALPGDKH